MSAEPSPTSSPRVFWIGTAIGAGLIAFGVAGALVDARRTVPFRLGVLLVGGAVVHDLVLVPVVMGVGVLLARAAPASVRRPVSMFLIAAGSISLYALPFVAGLGGRPGNTSALPLDYGRGLFLTLAAAVALSVIATLARRARCS